LEFPVPLEITELTLMFVARFMLNIFMAVNVMGCWSFCRN